MKLTIIVDALQAAGVAPDVVLIVLRAVEAAASVEAREAREMAAEKTERERIRKAKYRSKTTTMSHDVPRDTMGHRAKPNEINGHVPQNGAEPSKPLSSVSKKEEGKEGKGRKSRPKASRLPSNWEPERAWIDEAVAAGLSEQQATMEACKIRDWSLSSPAGAKLDWHATWRNWFRRRVEELPQNRPTKPKRESIGDMFRNDFLAAGGNLDDIFEKITGPQGNTNGSDGGADGAVISSFARSFREGD